VPYYGPLRDRLRRETQAWSRIVHTLIPNATVLTKHLAKLADACNATEIVLFERTTFLVIATSSQHPSQTPPAPAPSALPSPSASTPSTLSSFGSHTSHASVLTPEEDDSDPHKLDPTRYERTSELIKAFKQSCTRVREEFHALEMELADFTAVLDELTKNTYVLVVAHDPTVGSSSPFALQPAQLRP
jgi:Ras-related GTP-binding protein A/B